MSTKPIRNVNVVSNRIHIDSPFGRTKLRDGHRVTFIGSAARAAFDPDHVYVFLGNADGDGRTEQYRFRDLDTDEVVTEPRERVGDLLQSGALVQYE